MEQFDSSVEESYKVSEQQQRNDVQQCPICAAELTEAESLGRHVKMLCLSIILYADDILLLAPSVNALKKILHVCKKELDCLDLSILM